jgi:hypothetical protein
MENKKRGKEEETDESCMFLFVHFWDEPMGEIHRD